MAQSDMQAPEGSRTSPTAGTWIVLFLAAALIGAVSGGMMGYLTAGSAGGPAAPEGPVTFELQAFISGYRGVGGTIDGVVNPTLQVPFGTEVTVILTNGEALEHDWSLDGYGLLIPRLTSQGASETLTFTADQAGSFAYYCTVPGHRASGMEGLFIVGEGEAPAGPGPAQPVDVADIAKDPTELPPPLNRNVSATVHFYIEAQEVVAEIEPGTTFEYWAYNGTVPGPFLRVRVGDTVVVHLSNAASSSQNHSIDFHAVTGPGGGAVALQTPPGETRTLRFQAIHAGLFVYHCATPHIPTHIAKGLYGLVLVEPEGGLPAVDREYYVMQSELYTKWRPGTPGHQVFDGVRLLNEDPTYVVFNGRWQALTGDYALTAQVNETVRLYFGNIGVNLVSSFHIIGEHFDTVYFQADLLSPPQRSVQTTLVPAGGAVVVELKVEVPGTYLLVDHSLVRTIDKGALGFLQVAGPANPEIFQFPL